jgi:hypothetical protein
VNHSAEGKASAVLLDGLKVQRAGLPIAALTDIVAETLANRGSDILVPLNRARFEAKIIAAGFLLDFAVALDGIE